MSGKPFVLWFTGLSGVGKSTMARHVHARLAAVGLASYILDGDILREGLCSNLGFSPQDRHENIRRAAHTARILQEAGLIVLAAFITPYAEDRCMLRQLFVPGTYFEVHVDCPLTVCQRRDPKALYQRAESGLVRDFTGISQPYEVPEHPDVRISTETLSIEESAQQVWDFLCVNQLVPDRPPSLMASPMAKDRLSGLSHPFPLRGWPCE
jgi:adenylyl-sulfate kinase